MNVCIELLEQSRKYEMPKTRACGRVQELKVASISQTMQANLAIKLLHVRFIEVMSMLNSALCVSW